MYEAQIERGAALLDEVAPGWRSRVRGQLHRLDMCSASRCVLGLVFGDYGSALHNVLRGRMAESAPAYFGFNAGSYQAYVDLTIEWRAYLTQVPAPAPQVVVVVAEPERELVSA